MTKKKLFFAQDNNRHPDHRAAYFWTIKEAEDWLKNRRGGTIKKRGLGVTYVMGEPIKTWGEVKNV